MIFFWNAETKVFETTEFKVDSTILYPRPAANLQTLYKQIQAILLAKPFKF